MSYETRGGGRVSLFCESETSNGPFAAILSHLESYVDCKKCYVEWEGVICFLECRCAISHSIPDIFAVSHFHTMLTLLGCINELFLPFNQPMLTLPIPSPSLFPFGSTIFPFAHSESLLPPQLDTSPMQFLLHP